MSTPKRCSLRKVLFEEVASELPTVEVFTPSSIEHVDVLILAKGFEDRVLSAPKALIEAGKITAKTRVWIAAYSTNSEDNEARYLQLQALLEGHSQSIDFFDGDSPEMAAGQLASLLRELAPKSSVVFDVSGSSTTVIFSVLGALAQHGTLTDLRVVYTTAEIYYPDNGYDEHTPDSRHSQNFMEQSPIDSGTTEPASHAFFRGVQQDSKPIHVIAVPGIGSYDRFERCISYVAEDGSTDLSGSITLVLPYSDDTSHRFREQVLLSHMRNRFLLPSEGSKEGAFGIERCDFMTYTHIIQAITSLADAHLGSNVSLVHFGTKMQSVGAALALCARSEVALIFSRPKRFDASHYSSGSGKSYQLVLGSVRNVVALIQSIGAIQVSRDEAEPNARATAAS